VRAAQFSELSEKNESRTIRDSGEPVPSQARIQNQACSCRM